MAGSAGYDIPDDDIGLVKTIVLQVIREVAKKPAGKILRENVNVYRGTRHLQSILQELSQILHKEKLNSSEQIGDLALCLQRKILEMRKESPETFSWIPVNLETDEIDAFFLELKAKFGGNNSACSVPEPSQQVYNTGDDLLNHNQRVRNINTTEINTPVCTTTSSTARDSTNEPQTLTRITTSNLVQATDVSDNVGPSLMIPSTLPVNQMGTSHNPCATTTENVQPNYNVPLLTGESFINLPVSGFSTMSTKGISHIQKETTDHLSSQITPLGQNVRLSAHTENGTENMTYPQTSSATVSHSDTFSAQLPQGYSGASLISTSAEKLMQSLNEQESVVALLSLSSAAHVDSSYQTNEMNNVPTVDLTSTITPPTEQIMYDDTRGDIADSSQDSTSLNTDERNISAPESMPISGSLFKQDISCLSKSRTTKKPKTRCQYCDYLDEADIGLYKDIRGMSQVRKEQTIRTYIKSAPPLSKGKGKRQISNEYYLPYQDGKRRRVCRETFEKYFKTCRNTISKVTKKDKDQEDVQTCRDGISTETEENQQNEDSQVEESQQEEEGDGTT